MIGGRGSGGGDTNIPPEPVFGLYSNGQGTVEVMGIAFREWENTRGITAGTLVLWYDDEIAPLPGIRLAAEVLADETDVKLATSGTAAPGDVIVVGSEVMMVADLMPDGMGYKVIRGSHGSDPATHEVGENIVHLKRRTEILPFLSGFFGSPGREPMHTRSG